MCLVSSHPIPLKGGDEQDALTSWRKRLKWRNGARKKTKRRYNRRVRRDGKLIYQE